MKKKLLVLAVATLLPMGAAQAGVTIYGKIHASIDYIDPQGWEEKYRIDEDLDLILKYDPDGVWDVESRASRIGFKGSEDLGNGLKLIWKVESGVNIADSHAGKKGKGLDIEECVQTVMDGIEDEDFDDEDYAGVVNACSSTATTPNSYWTGRNAYIGLTGGWGTFLYGRHDTPMKMSTGKLDVFSDELADYNATAGFTDIRANDAIAYVSPSWGGFTLAGAIVPDGDYDGDGDLAGGYSVAAMWTIGGGYLAGAWEDLGDLNQGFTAERYRFGVGWDIGNFFIGGVYENEDLGGDDIDKYQVSAAFKFGNNKVKAMYADYDANFDESISNIVDSAGGDSWAVGFDHNFSKRSKMYVQYADSDRALMTTNNSVNGSTGFSMGMVHKF